MFCPLKLVKGSARGAKKEVPNCGHTLIAEMEGKAIRKGRKL
jgi:hypothetical protein